VQNYIKTKTKSIFKTKISLVAYRNICSHPVLMKFEMFWGF